MVPNIEEMLGGTSKTVMLNHSDSDIVSLLSTCGKLVMHGASYVLLQCESQTINNYSLQLRPLLWLQTLIPFRAESAELRSKKD